MGAAIEELGGTVRGTAGRRRPRTLRCPDRSRGRRRAGRDRRAEAGRKDARVRHRGRRTLGRGGAAGARRHRDGARRARRGARRQPGPVRRERRLPQHRRAAGRGSRCERSAGRSADPSPRRARRSSGATRARWSSRARRSRCWRATPWRRERDRRRERYGHRARLPAGGSRQRAGAGRGDRGRGAARATSRTRLRDRRRQASARPASCRSSARSSRPPAAPRRRPGSRATCLSYGLDEPYRPFRQILRQALGPASTSTGGGPRLPWRAWWIRPRTAEVAPLLGMILGLAPEGDDASRRGARSRRVAPAGGGRRVRRACRPGWPRGDRSRSPSTICTGPTPRRCVSPKG